MKKKQAFTIQQFCQHSHLRLPSVQSMRINVCHLSCPVYGVFVIAVQRTIEGSLPIITGLIDEPKSNLHT